MNFTKKRTAMLDKLQIGMMYYKSDNYKVSGGQLITLFFLKNV